MLGDLIIDYRLVDVLSKSLTDSCFFHYLKMLNTNNAQGEYYLTDVLEKINTHSNGKIGAFITQNANETLGVNTPEELAYLETLL